MLMLLWQVFLVEDHMYMRGRMNKTLVVVVGGRKQPGMWSHVNATTASFFRVLGIYKRGRNE